MANRSVAKRAELAFKTLKTREAELFLLNAFVDADCVTFERIIEKYIKSAGI